MNSPSNQRHNVLTQILTADRRQLLVKGVFKDLGDSDSDRRVQLVDVVIGQKTKRCISKGEAITWDVMV